MTLLNNALREQDANAREAERLLTDLESDDGLALEFVKAQQGDLRWVERWGRWFEWTGKFWREDTTLGVYDATRAFLRNHATTKRERMLDARRVAAVERLARSDRAVATTPDDMDAEPWLLNTQSGVVNLRNGELKPHNRELLLTKITSCELGDKCPQWESFLHDVTGDDPELIAFLQRVAGYCLTGSTREHALFFFYGDGGNGKGTYLNTLRAILADYAAVSSTDVFTAGRGSRHPTELAALRGARLVAAQEVEEGRKWAEARIKALTGGDPVSARFMRQDFFEYLPEFKLIIAGNHKPRLSTVDEAIRRRLHLVPFDVTIEEDKRDPDLAEKLAKEHPGILAWAVKGCLEYQSKGLAPPERVRAATDAYFASQDLLAEFVEECCETGPDCWETPKIMFSAWKRFAATQDVRSGTRSEFNDRMESAGYTQMRDRRRGRHWAGIKTKSALTGDPGWGSEFGA